MIRVFAAGVFDFFHPGHRFFLQCARALGDELFVVIARDHNVLAQKGFFPHFSEEERLLAVQTSHLADRVFLGDREDFLKSIKAVRPDIIALGYDQYLPPLLTTTFPAIRIVRIPAKNPEIWKSSVFRKKTSSP